MVVIRLFEAQSAPRPAEIRGRRTKEYREVYRLNGQVRLGSAPCQEHAAVCIRMKSFGGDDGRQDGPKPRNVPARLDTQLAGTDFDGCVTDVEGRRARSAAACRSVQAAQ